MKLLTDISINYTVPGRVLILLASMLVLSACATRQHVDATPPVLQNSGPEIQVADVDILAVTPAMDAFLERYILPYRDSHTKLNLLTLAVTSDGVLGFDYDEERTLTAAQAFETRSGNCIGFANMMIALARRAGLNARYQEVVRQRQWDSREDTLLIVKHINVIVESSRYNYVVDVSGLRFNENARRRVLEDPEAEAMYFNNIGAEALLENELPTAHAYLRKSIETASGMPDAWTNLGVVFGRNEQFDDAEFAYNTALQIDGSEYAAMSNLYEVYLEQGNLEEAEAIQSRVERYRRRNPYYLMMLSEEALGQARFEESISLLEKAIRKKDDDHVLYFALAKTQYLSGETTAAETSLHRARELAPEDMMAYYSRPLGELVIAE